MARESQSRDSRHPEFSKGKDVAPRSSASMTAVYRAGSKRPATSPNGEQSCLLLQELHGKGGGQLILGVMNYFRYNQSNGNGLFGTFDMTYPLTSLDLIKHFVLRCANASL